MVIKTNRIQQVGLFLLFASLLAPRGVFAQERKIRFEHLFHEGERWQSGQVYEILQDDVSFKWQPHLMWMDMRMPVMDGREATRRIRSRQAQEAEGKGVVIVALTASAFEEERAEILASGCDDLIRKPFREHEIFEMLHKHLGIDFVYVPEPESVVAPGVLTADRLQALPGEWRSALQDAAEETNPGAANAVIQQIREHDEPLAHALAELVRTYRFDTLQALFEGAEA